MDGWVNGWMAGLMDRWVDGRVGEWINGWMPGLMDRWIDG